MYPFKFRTIGYSIVTLVWLVSGMVEVVQHDQFGTDRALVQGLFWMFLTWLVHEGSKD